MVYGTTAFWDIKSSYIFLGYKSVQQQFNFDLWYEIIKQEFIRAAWILNKRFVQILHSDLYELRPVWQEKLHIHCVGCVELIIYIFPVNMYSFLWKIVTENSFELPNIICSWFDNVEKEREGKKRKRKQV